MCRPNPANKEGVSPDDRAGLLLDVSWTQKVLCQYTSAQREKNLRATLHYYSTIVIVRSLLINQLHSL